MNAFNRRLISQLINTLEKYKKNEINEFGVENNFSGTVNAIEGNMILRAVREICDSIEVELWSEDDNEKSLKINEYISRLKSLIEKDECIQIQENDI